MFDVVIPVVAEDVAHPSLELDCGERQQATKCDGPVPQVASSSLIQLGFFSLCFLELCTLDGGDPTRPSPPPPVGTSGSDCDEDENDPRVCLDEDE
jgi:hypothetical protein